MKKVAIITRTKNREIFLKRAIESVANQTYKNYVHVIVNDGGDIKGVEDVIEGFNESVRDSINVFHRNRSSDAPDTIFNESIDRVNSEYVVIHDDDDTWHREFLERTVPVLEAGSRGVVVRTDKVKEIVNGNSVKLLKKEHYMPNMKVVNLYQQCIDNQLTPISFIYRRDVYEEVGKYDSSLPVVGDWEFGIRFLKKYDIDFMDPGFALANYHYRKTNKVLSKDNSFKNHDHRYYFNIVANKYLRQEMNEGKLGVGYIINSLKYQQGYLAKIASRALPKKAVKIIKSRFRD